MISSFLPSLQHKDKKKYRKGRHESPGDRFLDSRAPNNRLAGGDRNSYTVGVCVRRPEYNIIMNKARPGGRMRKRKREKKRTRITGKNVIDTNSTTRVAGGIFRVNPRQSYTSECTRARSCNVAFNSCLCPRGFFLPHSSGNFLNATFRRSRFPELGK